MKEFLEFLKLPPTILSALALGSGLLLFLPIEIRTKIYMDTFMQNYGFIVGIIFVISISLLGVYGVAKIYSKIKNALDLFKLKIIRKKHLKKIDNVKVQLIKEFLNEEDHTLELDANNGTTIELEYWQIITKAGNTQISYNYDIIELKYFLQPWVREMINKDKKLQEKFK